MNCDFLEKVKRIKAAYDNSESLENLDASGDLYDLAPAVYDAYIEVAKVQKELVKLLEEHHDLILGLDCEILTNPGHGHLEYPEYMNPKECYIDTGFCEQTIEALKKAGAR